MYIGRFAPSPSGPLHDGSLCAALASYLDARAHRGRWLLRIEDVDTPRVVAGAERRIIEQLHGIGLRWDGDVVRQSDRHAAYAEALAALDARGRLYGCACSRREIAEAAARLGHGLEGETPYAGTCRHGLAPGREARAWRLRVADGTLSFDDRWCGPQRQDVAREVGDFVLRRADGLWAYQLAVVVDDGWQGVTDVVRGADLLSSTARQIVLQGALDLPTPRYMHVPLVIHDNGQKLSKQTQAQPFDRMAPLDALRNAWAHLGFAPLPADNVDTFLARATEHWAQRWDILPDAGQAPRR